MKTVIVQSQQRWENMVVSRRTETTLIEELNNFGLKGWEVVSILYYKDPKGVMAWSAFLKRPCSGTAPAAVQITEEAEGEMANVVIAEESHSENVPEHHAVGESAVVASSSILRAVKIEADLEDEPKEEEFKIRDE
jgi:hypothetical protein